MDQPEARLPEIFHVNWFRKDADGKFLWPGFGENLRVLQWMIARVEGKARATETPIGWLPAAEDLELDGAGVSEVAMAELLRFDAAGWREEVRDLGTFLDEFGERMPPALRAEQGRLLKLLSEQA